MQKGDRNKLRLLLSGIAARMTKNQAYFTHAKCEFVSGRKRSEATLSRTLGGYQLAFQGTERTIDAPTFCSFFAEQASLYEQATLFYTERGTVVTLAVSDKGVKLSQAERQSTEDEQRNANHPLLDRGRRYWIGIDKATDLLREIGILTAEGKLKNDKIRKYNQIDHYVELVAPMFEQVEDEEILLLDCACGKSYLSFVMNYYLREVCKRRCRIIGIDISEQVITRSREMAARLGYHNMEFLCADLRTYQPPAGVTAVISLHACDIATDLALACALHANAKLIACVPCCHKELLDQYTLPDALSPLIRHGVFRARMNDLLTDSMRALALEAQGYQVSVVEYISPLDTPKNLLLRAVRTNSPNPKAQEEYHRAQALLGTTSELDRRLQAQAMDDFFITDADLLAFR